MHKKKSIAFRTDASLQIGTGHFMRCLTLADGLIQLGTHIRFISRELPAHLRDMLTAKGMEFVLLDSNANNSHIEDLAHAHWLGSSQAQDAQTTIQALSGQSWDWLVVDHYALDACWESALRCTTKQIMAIDDIADRQHDCDMLLDQNFYSDMDTRYTGKVPVHCRLLLGPRYALLREEFRQLHEQVKPRNRPAKRILVFFGGVDADNYTGRAIEALSEIDMSGLHVDAVIGAQHPCREPIETACRERGFTCHVQTDKMAELMATADLAIGAGGSACWERCCLGLPALLVALAENQINIAKDLDRYGACTYIGSAKSASAEILQNAIGKLLNAPNQLRALSEKAYSLVDGMGADRVCRELSC